MLDQILSGKYPSHRYRNCVEGNYDGDTIQFGLFDSFYRIQDDIVRHTRRCVRSIILYSVRTNVRKKYLSIQKYFPND